MQISEEGDAATHFKWNNGPKFHPTDLSVLKDVNRPKLPISTYVSILRITNVGTIPYIDKQPLPKNFARKIKLRLTSKIWGEWQVEQQLMLFLSCNLQLAEL